MTLLTEIKNTIRNKVMLAIYPSIAYKESMVRNRLREILQREKVTAYRLYKELGIDQGQLSHFFNGEASLSLKKLEQIAEYLGYDIVLVKRKRSRKGGS